MFKRLFILALAILFVAGMASKADALYGLEKYWFSVVDEYGNAITSGTTSIYILVYTAGTTTKATIYSDDQATAKSQTTAWNPSTSGVAEFWSTASSVDVVVDNGKTTVLKSGLTTGEHQIMIKGDAPVNIERNVKFSLTDFSIQDAVLPLLLSVTSVPGLEEDNNLMAMVWADGEVTPAQVTFRVPEDYVSGGAFRIFADESDSTTPNQIDFQVYVNTDGSAFDAAVTNQTPVALSEAAGTAELVALSVTTDFASLAAGQLVSLEIWRDDTATGTGDLEVYFAEFYYKSGE